ncbi:ABC transporter ATP-binding protein [Ligaoa zhengdingensis]|uniref:ABC transporter ATP-binding protein n=1 Tax=Ligaoa zhengdingensis TaxID=2763658 RepID=UPI0031BBCBA6
MELFSIKDLSFTYPDEAQKVLNSVNLTVSEGEFMVVCGPSGCGKTTLLRLLKRELSPHGKREGEIRYLGTLQEELDDRVSAGEIGCVMQNPENQVVTDKVWHELAFGLENLGLPNGEIRRRVGEMASFFGINRWFDRKTSELSGGQKQLLNLASVMVMQPRVLILDEPTSQLDPVGAAEFITTLHKLNRDLGLTILLVEHRLEEVFAIADKAVVMDRGRVLFNDTPRTVGGLLRDCPEKGRMLLGMPSAVRIFSGLNATGACPLTVKEGRLFLKAHASNQACRRIEDGELKSLGKELPAVQTKELWFRYERNLPDVLKGLYLTVEQGEIFAVLGENGSGKSTMLRAISGQNAAYRGKVELFGKKLQSYKGTELYRHNVAFLPQDPQSVFLKPTVKQDFQEICSAMGYEKQEAEGVVARLAEQLEISALLDRHPYDLSGGEQQRAALCKVLLLRPRLLLLDEPTKGIDAYAKNTLEQILKELQQQGITTIMVTHDVEFAASCADRCAMLFHGEIMDAERPREFFSTNTFYTTAASRISRTLYENTVTVEDVVELCSRNGGLQ